MSIINCDICYNERPTDMMMRCCNNQNVRVCECNVSICRRCADSMSLKCPTCRSKCNKFTYVDEAKNKPIKPEKKVRSPATLLSLSDFTVGQDVFIYQKYQHHRKAKIVRINSASVTIKYYSYTANTNITQNGYYAEITYQWNQRLEPETMVVKRLERLITRNHRIYGYLFDSNVLVTEEYLMR